MSRMTFRSMTTMVWNVVKGGLMLAGLLALVTWEVQTFSHATPAPAQAAAKIDAVATPVLEGVHPSRVAESLALADAPSDRPAPSADKVLTSADRAMLGNAAEHKRIADYLAKKYMVSSEATQLIVAAAYLTGKETGVDPLLILAVMAIESRFNPFAESGMGAQGLMQVIPKYHLDKFEEMGGKDAVLNPVANIKVGALILKDYISRFGGVEAGLKAYSGAALAEEDFGYSGKVLGERERIRAASGVGKSMPVKAAPKQFIAPPAKIEET